MWLNAYVPSTAESEFKRVLKDVGSFLRPHRFRRSGQRFGRETEECWNVIGFQKSRYSDSSELRFTVNIGITSKTLMEFRGKDVSKMPVEWECPLRSRIGHLLGQGDLWWSSRDADGLTEATATISVGLSEKVIPFLDHLQTNAGVLALYETGKIMGFEIDRDETRVVLVAHSGLEHEASKLVTSYAERWLPGATSRRATDFLAAYRARIGVASA
jgi:hypothetical protein